MNLREDCGMPASCDDKGKEGKDKKERKLPPWLQKKKDSKTDESVDLMIRRLLGEEGDEDAFGRDSEAERRRPRRQVGPPGTDDPDAEDEGGEERFEEELMGLLEEAGHRCETFESAGLMTRNRGLVVTTSSGKFQVEIVEDTRH